MPRTISEVFRRHFSAYARTRSPVRRVRQRRTGGGVGGNRRRVEEAKAREDLFILTVAMKPAANPSAEKGVIYCGTELKAQLVKTSMLPSQCGNQSLLDDVMIKHACSN